MDKLASKATRRIMAVALSLAMMLSNMTVYASGVSDPVPQTEETVEDAGIDAAELLSTQDETAPNETAAENETAPNEAAAEAAVSPSATEQDEGTQDGIAHVEDSSNPAYSIEGGATESYALASGTKVSFAGMHNPATALSTLTDFQFGDSQFQDPINNSHGLQSKSADATITFTVPGTSSNKVDINVLLCTFGASKSATMTASSGTVVKDLVAESESGSGRDVPKYTVLGVTGGSEITLTFSSNTYIHYIEPIVRASGVEYNTITVTSGENGDAYASPIYAKAGDTVTLTAVPTSGFGVKAWTVKDASDADVTVSSQTDTVITFAMPASAVTASVDFEQQGTEQDIAIDENTLTGGTVSAKDGGSTKAISGATVVVGDAATFAADEGYHFKAWKVTDASGTSVAVTKSKDGNDPNKGKYVFTMPESTATISAEFEADSTELRTYWNFMDTSDDTIFGVDNTVDYNYNSGEHTVAGLEINGVFKTMGRINSGYAQVAVGTTIKVPVAGPCKVTVETYEKNGCTVDSKSFSDADSKTGVFNCEGTDGYVTIGIPSTVSQAYLTSIKVELSVSYTITPAATADHATITPVTNGVTSAEAGATVKLSEVATVTINTADAETYELTGWTVAYTEDGTGKTINAVKGADGEYTFTMPAADVTITPVITEKASTKPATSWDFKNDLTFHNGDYAYNKDGSTGYVYNGLKIPAGAGAYNNGYLYANNGHTISVPVSGNCTITVNTQHGQSYYFADEGIEHLQANGTAAGNEYSYDYEGEAGYVDIAVTATTYFTKIEVKPLAQKFAVTLVTEVDHATVTPAAGAPAEVKEGATVKLNELATVEADDGYEFARWDVTYTEGGAKVDVAYDETDGYTFVMPQAAVTITPAVSEVLVDRDITLVPKAGAETLTAADLEGTIITFVNTENPSNKVSYTIGTEGEGVTALDAIKLKNGTYKVSVYNNKIYVNQPIPNFTVTADNTVCTIQFDKNPTSWDFSDEVFQGNYSSGTHTWYNGIKLTNITSYSNPIYAYLTDGSRMEIPVSGECNVTVTYYGGAQWLNASVGDKDYVLNDSETAAVTYHYTGTEVGTVAITATGQAVVGTIRITESIAEPEFSPVNEDATKSEYDFDTKTGEVRLTTATDGAVVKYVVNKDFDTEADFTAINEGNILASDKLKDAQPIVVTADGTVIKAIAVSADGMTASGLVSYTYNINENGSDAVAAPTASPNGGKVQVGTEVELIAADGAVIHYTVDGSPVTAESTTYSEKIKLETAGTVTINAIAVKDDVTSVVVSYVYTVVNVTKLTRVSISGRLSADSQLTANLTFSPAGTPDSAQTTTAYEWYRVPSEGEPVKIEGATGSTYIVNETADSGYKIRVKVTFTDELGTVTDMEATTSKAVGEKGSGNGLEIEFDKGKVYTYTGTAIKPAITVTNNGDELIEGVHYTVKYSNNVKAGGDAAAPATADYDKKAPGITVTGKGNFSGKTQANFVIKPKDLGNKDAGTVNAEDVPDVVTDAIVTLEGAKLNPVLFYAGAKLTAKDFAYADDSPLKKGDKVAADAAAKEVKLTGANNFAGEVTIPVITVTKDEQKKNKIYVDFKDKNAVKNITYTGAAPEVEYTVGTVSAKTGDGLDLVKDTDYVISYPADMVSAGTKKVTFTGISAKCVGSVTKSFAIKPAAKAGRFEVEGVKADPEGYDFVSAGVTFGDEVTVSYVDDTDAANKIDLELKEGVDYKISYSNNKKAGTAKYTITGLGNYKGLKKTTDNTFTIKPLALSNTNMRVVAADKVFTKAGVYKSVPYVIANGTLVKASEYKVEYKVGDATEWSAKLGKIESIDETIGYETVHIKITAKKAAGNYGAEPAAGDELTGSYKVVSSAKTDLAKAKITFLNKDDSKAKVGYTGNAVTPYKAVIKCKNVDDVEIILDETAEDFSTNGYEVKGFDVTFTDNELKGKATVIIEAGDDNANYAGGKTATFSIVQKNLQKDLAADEGFKKSSVTRFIKSLFNK